MSQDKPIVIFGTGQLADLADFYWTEDSPRKVAAFTLDRDYMTTDRHRDRPVVPFERLTDSHPPADYDLFLPISYIRMNEIRKDRFEAARRMGYRCPSYVSSKATTYSDLDVGQNCFVFEDNTIQPFVKIGDNCTLWSGNHIGHHTVIEDHVFITSHVVISGACLIGERSFFGVNATVRDQTTIGARTLVGMGASVTRDTAEGEVRLAPKSVRAEMDSADVDLVPRLRQN